MGDVAASGGYLAAMRADVIVAQPTTITASIGVFGIWPVATELLTSLGVNVERLSVGTNAGMYSTFQAPTAAQRAAIPRELDVIYADFTRQVGEARKLEGSRLDAAARGRVFSGIDAKKAGLIDELGGLQLALNIAKAKAGIDESRQVELRPFPPSRDRWQKVVERLLRLAGPTPRVRPSARRARCATPSPASASWPPGQRPPAATAAALALGWGRTIPAGASSSIEEMIAPLEWRAPSLMT